MTPHGHRAAWQRQAAAVRLEWTDCDNPGQEPGVVGDEAQLGVVATPLILTLGTQRQADL